MKLSPCSSCTLPVRWLKNVRFGRAVSVRVRVKVRSWYVVENQGTLQGYAE